MRTKLNITEGIFPMPVLMIATYNEDGSVNVMNAAWGTMQERGTVALNLTETHKTVQNIKARGAFTVSVADAAHIVEADYFGVESGNQVPDKFARSGLTASKAETVDAPVIQEFPICLECKFVEYQHNAYGCGVIGKVVNVTADERVMENGTINMSLVNAIAFDPYTHGYYRNRNAYPPTQRLRPLHPWLLQSHRARGRSLPGRLAAEKIIFHDSKQQLRSEQPERSCFIPANKSFFPLFLALCKFVNDVLQIREGL